MLHYFVQYAQQQGIDAEAGFSPKNVRWLVVFNAKGQFLNTQDLADPDLRRAKGRTFPKVPHLKFAGDTPMRQFLVDTAEYALLYDQDDPSEKLRTKHEYFLNLMRQGAGADARFGVVAEAIAHTQTRQRICQNLAEKRAKSSDNVTFAVIEHGEPAILVEETGWHDWWRGYFTTLFPPEEKVGATPCLLSGTLVEPARTHPKIKGLGGVGGKVETTMVGFNESAFCSFGLEQSRNAAIGKEPAEQYAAALNDLIANHSHTLAGAKVVYWFAGEKNVPPEDDPVRMLLGDLDFGNNEVDEETPAGDSSATSQRREAQTISRARALLDAIRTGERPDLSQCHYYALTLSGNSARVVVRDWMEGQFEDLVRNIESWFNDFEITSRDGLGPAPSPKFAAVLAATTREIADVPAPLVTKLWHTALQNIPIPPEAMVRTLARVRVDIVQDEPLRHARMGLLKAFCIRNGDKNMKPFLNEDHPDPAYHCGRLLAVLAYIQYKALGDVGAGVIQRYYAAASATPALVLGRLMRTTQFHLDKIEDKGIRLGLDKRLAEIWSRIKNDVPNTLTLEGQTLFAMGYYHQKAYRGVQGENEQIEQIQ